MLWGKNRAKWKGRQLLGIKPRTPGLCSQCSATELRQLDNHQPHNNVLAHAEWLPSVQLRHFSPTCTVDTVIEYIQSNLSSADLSLKDLSVKLVTLLALGNASRASDLASLDIRFQQFTPEGVHSHPRAYKNRNMYEALPWRGIVDLTRICKIWCEVGIPLVARRIYDSLSQDLW